MNGPPMVSGKEITTESASTGIRYGQNKIAIDFRDFHIACALVELMTNNYMGIMGNMICIWSSCLATVLTSGFVLNASGGQTAYPSISQALPELQHHKNSASNRVTNQAIYDPAPVPYCNVSFDTAAQYSELESEVTASDPAGKTLAQFVLEAFAQANADNTTLDSVSQSDVVTALTKLQAMWVPAALNFKTNYTDTGITDTNQVAFVTEQLIQVPYRFPKLLAQYGPVGQSGTIENLLAALLTDGQAGELNQAVDVSYTNVYLTQICNLILIGQGPEDGNNIALVPADTTTLNTGRTNFMNWASTVLTYGVHEFLSPTYTGDDMEMVANVELFAQDPGILEMAQQAVKEAWIDMYANWYNQDQRLGGTHSRTYEFLTDENRTTDRYIYAASNPATPSSPAWPNLLPSRTPRYWRGQDYTAYILPPPANVPNLFPAQVSSNNIRTILRDFGYTDPRLNAAFMYAENYMANPLGTGGLTYPFSVGSAQTAYFDNTFEGLTIMLPGNGNTPNVNYNMQGRGDYYLQELAADGKSDTLEPYIASVQNGAETLFLATSSAEQDASATTVASTIVLPNSAQVWIGTDSAPVVLSSGGSVTINNGATIFIQVSNAGQSDALVTGIRFLLSTDMTGNGVELALVNDGSAYNALRITCLHAASTPSAGNAVIGFWTRTGYTSDLSNDFKAFRSALISAAATATYDISSGDVLLSVPGWNSTMTVQANVINQTISSLSGGDVESAAAPPFLAVNGTEYLATTIQAWNHQDIGDATGGSSTALSLKGLYTGQVQLAGAGTDIWGTADGFQFYYQQLTGDGTVIGRLVDMPTGGQTNPWAKAGLMMRNDLTPGSMNAYVSLDGTHGQRFSVRTAENAASTRYGNATTTTPYWFKLTRLGNTFTGYSSPDGVTWTEVASPVTIQMSSTIYVGIGVTSCNTSSPITTVFDNVGVIQ
jgi:hypothetical protein